MKYLEFEWDKKRIRQIQRSMVSHLKRPAQLFMMSVLFNFSIPKILKKRIVSCFLVQVLI